MQTNEQIKELVREKYAEIAEQGLEQNQASCCGATSACCGDEVYGIMADDYTKLDGYNADADLGLGCGLPTEYAKIKEGDTVIDLGSGAGNDAFVARKIVGEKGRVMGIDFTEPMIKKARARQVRPSSATASRTSATPVRARSMPSSTTSARRSTTRRRRS